MFGILENHHNLYSWFPKMEKTTFDVSLVYFLLMFGFKIFSLYYPLFLISIGFSVLSVGGIYLLTYSVIAISSIIINYYIHRFNPAKIAAVGIFGYGVFALMMLLSSNSLFLSWIGWATSLDLPIGLIIFYIAQVILGFSAAAWLVSLRLILMKSKTDSHSRSFGWFYSMPHYAAALAPAIGGVVIWKFGFAGVFALSVLIQFANAVYAYARLNGNCWFHNSQGLGTVKSVMQKDSINLTHPQPLSRGEYRHSQLPVSNTRLQWGQYMKVSPMINLRKKYSKIFGIIKSDKTFTFILLSLFSVLILGGIYRAFFVLFLENLRFSQEEIIKFISIASLAYLPLSIMVIKIIEKFRDAKIISGGMIVEGSITVILGIFAGVINLLGMFFIMIIDSLGALTLGSGKSSLLSKKFKNYQEEASTVDTVLTTLGPALGALIGGIAIFYMGFQNTFLFAGVVVFMLGMISWFLRLKT